MTIRVFRDFDGFADAITGVTGRLVVTGRSQAEWSVQTVTVGRVIVQRVQTGAASAFIGEGEEGMAVVGAPASAPELLRVDGRALSEDSLIVVGEGRSFTFSSRDAAQWLGVAAPIDHPDLPAYVARRFEARADQEAQSQSRAFYVAYASQTIQRVLTAVESGDMTAPAAQCAAEEDLVRILVHGMRAKSRHDAGGVRRSKYSRKRVIARALALMDSSAGQPLFINDLCRATRVSERTLRDIFQEYFGVGPIRLLKVHRLCGIHRALLNAEPGETRVREIAAHFGVWDFSLFARTYRELFGERPTDTLHRAGRASGLDLELDETWIRYACRKFGEVTRVGGRKTHAYEGERARLSHPKTWSGC